MKSLTKCPKGGGRGTVAPPPLYAYANASILYLSIFYYICYCRRVTLKMDVSFADHSHIIGKGNERIFMYFASYVSKTKPRSRCQIYQIINVRYYKESSLSLKKKSKALVSRLTVNYCCMLRDFKSSDHIIILASVKNIFIYQNYTDT